MNYFNANEVRDALCLLRKKKKNRVNLLKEKAPPLRNVNPAHTQKKKKP